MGAIAASHPSATLRARAKGACYLPLLFPMLATFPAMHPRIALLPAPSGKAKGDGKQGLKMQGHVCLAFRYTSLIAATG